MTIDRPLLTIVTASLYSRVERKEKKTEKEQKKQHDKITPK